MQVCETGADGAILESKHFEPGRPLEITGGLFNSCGQAWPYSLGVGETKMTDWKADLDALVQESMAFTKSIPVEPPMPRTIVEPNRMPPVNLNNSERDENLAAESNSVLEVCFTITAPQAMRRLCRYLQSP
jgi:hypothetical protein